MGYVHQLRVIAQKCRHKHHGHQRCFIIYIPIFPPDIWTVRALQTMFTVVNMMQYYDQRFLPYCSKINRRLDANFLPRLQ
jgi:hypothetical protein